LNRDQKAAVIEEVAAQITESDAVFAVDYRGISVPQAAELRNRLREADASFRVVKNTLSERAADQAGAEGLKELLQGPTAMTFVRGDAATAAKALRDFQRANQLLEFKGGWMNGAPLTGDEINSIAQLPSRDVLYGRLVGMVASPLTGLVSALSGLVGGLARQLSQIAEQGLVGGDAPAPAPAASAAAAEPEPEAPAAAEESAPADEPAPNPKTENQED
jgi:large subunit ribosomal protein L10